ncbi:MAG: anti-sigma F factor antagonist [Halanaerobiales bacterium]
MKITCKNRGKKLLVRLKGDLDMHSAPEFKTKVAEKLEERNYNALILNFKGVDFIDSTGIGAILGRYRNLSNEGCEVVLVGLNPQVKKVFELSGLLKLMPVYEKEEEVLSNNSWCKEESI